MSIESFNPKFKRGEKDFERVPESIPEEEQIEPDTVPEEELLEEDEVEEGERDLDPEEETEKPKKN